MTEICIRLDRCSDRETIGCFPPLSSAKLEIETATMFARAWNLTNSAISRVEEQLRVSGMLAFKKYHLVVRSIPIGVESFRWTNVYQSQPLPDTVFMCIVSESAFIGSHREISTFYEGYPAEKVSFFLNEQAIGMQKEYKNKFLRTLKDTVRTGDSTVVGDAYWAFLEALCLEKPNFLDFPMEYRTFQLGNTLFTMRMPTCRGAQKVADSLDVEITFSPKTQRSLVCLVFGLESAHVLVDSARSYRLII